MLRALLQATAALLALAAIPTLRAEALVHLSVIDRDTGAALPEWPHRGDHWVEGAPGHRYALRLTNLTGARVLVVVSVDGVNAVSGQTARADQAGYVLAPWQTTEVTGWRKSLQDVAQFVFTDLQDSYAAQTGRPDNVGVIGMAVFTERLTVAVAPMASAAQAHREAARAPLDKADSAVTQGLGTGHGAREWAPASSTVFERASTSPQQQRQLRYDARLNLIALGVLPRRNPQPAHRPQAFPSGFVPDP